MTDDIVIRLLRISAFFAMGFVVGPLSAPRLLLLLVLLGVMLYVWDIEND
jgi:hypothetical protein